MKIYFSFKDKDEDWQSTNCRSSLDQKSSDILSIWPIDLIIFKGKMLDLVEPEDITHNWVLKNTQ